MKYKKHESKHENNLDINMESLYPLRNKSQFS